MIGLKNTPPILFDSIISISSGSINNLVLYIHKKCLNIKFENISLLFVITGARTDKLHRPPKVGKFKKPCCPEGQQGKVSEVTKVTEAINP